MAKRGRPRKPKPKLDEQEAIALAREFLLRTRPVEVLPGQLRLDFGTNGIEIGPRSK